MPDVFTGVFLFEEVIARTYVPDHIESHINLIKPFVVYHLIDMIDTIMIENHLFRIKCRRTAYQAQPPPTSCRSNSPMPGMCHVLVAHG